MDDLLYDTLIVGGGPAGLSAAIHLAWHQRRALVIDRVTGPLFFTLEKLWNVPGMPEATGAEIQKRLKAQAVALGAEIQRANVVQAAGREEEFLLTGAKGEAWRGRTLLLATGVSRYHPTVDGDFTPCFAYAGKGNLFYCSDCEGPELFGKDTIVIGAGPADWAAAMAVGLSRYTERLRLLLTAGRDLSPDGPRGSRNGGSPSSKGRSRSSSAASACSPVSSSRTAGPSKPRPSSSPARRGGRTDLAQQLGVEMAPTGKHAQAASQRGDTNVPGVWIAGDLRPMTQQVAVAMGTGNIAALMIDQHLRKKDVEPPRARV